MKYKRNGDKIGTQTYAKVYQHNIYIMAILYHKTSVSQSCLCSFFVSFNLSSHHILYFVRAGFLVHK